MCDIILSTGQRVAVRGQEEGYRRGSKAASLAMMYEGPHALLPTPTPAPVLGEAASPGLAHH